MSGTRPARAGLTRRRLLRAGGGLAAGVGLAGVAGCSDYKPHGSEAGHFTIPDPKVKLPAGDATFRLLDSNDTKSAYWKEFFAAYHGKHSNITCKYDGLPWNRIAEIVPLGIRNGTAHDVLQFPGSIPVAQAVAENWVAPIDDLIPDVKAWKATFPEGTFAEGGNVFDGKTYGIPLTSEQRHMALLHYNKKLMNDAGFDPESKPLTWDTYREAARKITKQGNGRAYGVVLEIAQTGRLAIWAWYAAASAGVAAVNYAPHGYMDPRTGDFIYSQDGVAQALELLLALKQDGSILPGSNSLLAPQAWPRVVRGDAGMVSGGPWVTALWHKQNPDFQFGVASHPLRDSNGFPGNYTPFGTDTVFVFSGSKVREVAADVMSYATSLDGQKAWGDIVGIGNAPILEDARKALKNLSAQEQKALDLCGTLVRRPEPTVRNPDVVKVAQAAKPLQPDFGQLIQDVLVGKTTDVRKALADLQSRSNKALDDAIAAAVKKGAKVSRQDFVSSDWDPRKDYPVKGN